MTRCLLPFAFIFSALLSQAQAPGPGSSTPIQEEPEPTAVLLDGGASLLLASGVAYGLKRLRQRRQAR